MHSSWCNDFRHKEIPYGTTQLYARELSFLNLALPQIGCAIGLWALSGRVSHNDARDIG